MCYLNNAYSLADPPNLTRPVLSLKVAPVFGYLSVVQLACSIQHRFFFSSDIYSQRLIH